MLPFRLEIPALPDGARLLAFHLVEDLARPFTCEVHASVTSPSELDLEGLVGADAALLTPEEEAEAARFAVRGVVSSAEVVTATDALAVLRLLVVPRLSLLENTVRSRVFTERSVPEILREVLADAGVSGARLRLQLERSYPTEAFVCQYDESDLAFALRWMEREGIHFFFDHEDDDGPLVLTDAPSSHRERGAIPYRPAPAADRSAGPCVDRWHARRRAVPAEVVVGDYDYARPALDLSKRAKVSKAGVGRVRRHAERFFSTEDADALAKVRAEELACREHVARGEGTSRALRAGSVFELDDHPIAALRGRYLVTRAEVSMNQAAGEAISPDVSDEPFRARFDAIPAGISYRPERRTPWPRVNGYERGVIDGEAASDYAQIDDQGRYRVKLAFDEAEHDAGKASTWVRMMQPHGGGNEGWHFPLRKGTEVILTFLGGDPDRPVIAGVVPNALTPSPVTGQNHTKNVIQTGGRNRIEMEDAEGSQRISIESPTASSFLRMGAPNHPFQWLAQTAENMGVKAEGFFCAEIGGPTEERRTGKVTHLYEKGYSLTVKGADVDVDIEKSVRLMIGGENTVDIEGRTTLSLGRGAVVKAPAGGLHVQVGDGWGVGYQAPLTATTTGDLDLQALGSCSVTADREFRLRSDTARLVADRGVHLQAELGPVVLMSSTGDIRIKAKGKIDLDAGGELQMNNARNWYVNNAGNTFNVTNGDAFAFTYGWLQVSATTVGMKVDMVGALSAEVAAIKSTEYELVKQDILSHIKNVAAALDFSDILVSDSALATWV